MRNPFLLVVLSIWGTPACVAQTTLDESIAKEIIGQKQEFNEPITLSVYTGEKIAVAETKTGSATSQSLIPFKSGDSQLGDFGTPPRVGSDLYRVLSEAGLISFVHLGGYVSGWKGAITYYRIELTDVGREFRVQSEVTRNPNIEKVEIKICEAVVREITAIKFTNEKRTEAIVKYAWEMHFVNNKVKIGGFRIFRDVLKWPLAGSSESYFAFYDDKWHAIT